MPLPISLSALLLALGVAAAPAAMAAEGELLLYTSQPNADAQATVDAFMARHPGVKASFVRDGTPKIMAKLRAEIEAGAPQADVLLIADVVTMEGLKAEGRLMAHPAADLSAYDPALHDRDRTYFSTKLITTGIVYNAAAPMKPESWADLLKPEAKGQIIMPSPLASGAALIHAVALTGNLPQGWGYYEGLAENGALAQGANGGVLQAVAGGEKLYGMIVDFMPIREKAKGAPVEFVFPAEGVSAVTEPVAVLSATKNPEAAKAFVDFLLSVEGQELAAAQGYMPAHPAVAPPAGFPDRASVKVLGFDAAKALAEEQANRDRVGALLSVKP
jgi:iron(III) transport system substrate-binding protein